MPVFTVGVGRETLDQGHPDRPRHHAAHRAQGHDADGRRGDRRRRASTAQTVTLDVEDEGRIVSTQKVTLPTTARRRPCRSASRWTRPARASCASACRALAGELVAENNQREALIDVRDRREKILYFEGEPRFELKFLAPRGHRRQEPRGRGAAAHRRQQVPAPRRRQRRRAGRPASRRRARSCSPIAASSSAASRPARSPAISCA